MKQSVHAPVLQKHNSMEHLLVSKAASRNNLSMIRPQVGASAALHNSSGLHQSPNALNMSANYQGATPLAIGPGGPDDHANLSLKPH